MERFYISHRGKKSLVQNPRCKTVELHNNYRENRRGKRIHLHRFDIRGQTMPGIEKRLKKRLHSEYSIQRHRYFSYPIFLHEVHESFVEEKKQEGPMRYLCELLVRVGETRNLSRN